MTEIDIMHIVYLILIGMGAGFVQRVSGFGLGIFVMLFLPHFMPHTEAATISCLFSCGTSVYNAIKYRKDIPFKTVMPVMIAAMIIIPVAVYFSKVVPGDVFKMIFGIVLIVLSIYFLFFQSRFSIKPTKINGIIAGALGGGLNGLFSTGGPPIVLYLTHATENNLAYFAGIQFYFAVTNVYATAMRFLNGFASVMIIILAVIGFMGCMAGDFIGRIVFEKLDAKKLKTVIYIGMIISGITMIL